MDVRVLVKPDTVIGWHRAGFRLYWRCRFRPAGRPTEDPRGDSRSDPTIGDRQLAVWQHPRQVPAGARALWDVRSDVLRGEPAHGRDRDSHGGRALPPRALAAARTLGTLLLDVNAVDVTVYPPICPLAVLWESILWGLCEKSIRCPLASSVGRAPCRRQYPDLQPAERNTASLIDIET
jgi:hypothetical protein